MTPLTLPAIHRLAIEYTPLLARLSWRLTHPDWWGPAHELGHALVALPHERRLSEFGLPHDAGSCRCPGERCHVVELAAMDVSRRLVTSAGRPDVAAREVRDTDDYDLMVHSGTVRAARRMIARRRLQRLPRTVEGLERMLRGRLA